MRGRALQIFGERTFQDPKGKDPKGKSSWLPGRAQGGQQPEQQEGEGKEVTPERHGGEQEMGALICYS